VVAIGVTDLEARRAALGLGERRAEELLPSAVLEAGREDRSRRRLRTRPDEVQRAVEVHVRGARHPRRCVGEREASYLGLPCAERGARVQRELGVEDCQIDPAVAVEVGGHDGAPAQSGRKRGARIGEAPTALVRRGPHRAARAVDPQEVDVPVVVELLGEGEQIARRQAGLRGRVGEGAGAVESIVAQQARAACRRDEQIDVALVVVVDRSDRARTRDRRKRRERLRAQAPRALDVLEQEQARAARVTDREHEVEILVARLLLLVARLLVADVHPVERRDVEHGLRVQLHWLHVRVGCCPCAVGSPPHERGPWSPAVLLLGVLAARSTIVARDARGPVPHGCERADRALAVLQRALGDARGERCGLGDVEDRLRLRRDASQRVGLVARNAGALASLILQALLLGVERRGLRLLALALQRRRELVERRHAPVERDERVDVEELAVQRLRECLALGLVEIVQRRREREGHGVVLRPLRVQRLEDLRGSCRVELQERDEVAAPDEHVVVGSEPCGAVEQGLRLGGRIGVFLDRELRARGAQEVLRGGVLLRDDRLEHGERLGPVRAAAARPEVRGPVAREHELGRGALVAAAAGRDRESEERRNENVRAVLHDGSRRSRRYSKGRAARIPRARAHAARNARAGICPARANNAPPMEDASHPAAAALATPAANDTTPAGRALVIGASSGIGAALVRELARSNWRVGALARRAGELEALRREAGAERVRTRSHDVHDRATVPGLFEELVRELGGLDLLIYAAGVMPAIGPQEFDSAKDAEIVVVNTLGAMAWCNAAAEYFQSRRAGTIVGISSIAGDRGRRGNPAYGASKAALAHYLEALRNRLGVFDVHVCTIKPGYIATPMTEGLGELSGLAKLLGKISAERAAHEILTSARRHRNVRYVPLRWLAVSLVLRSIPSVVFRRLSI
jgi:short-subunit dehydrogenase